jgi:Spy/CpxP family protein refolding chaperone
MSKVTVLLIVAVATLSFAQGGMYGGNGYRHQRGEGGYLRQELNLTQEQYDKLKADREDVSAEIAPIRDRIREIHYEMI